jgi:glycosyltransferase involved in cell wall biosynthesis
VDPPRAQIHQLLASSQVLVLPCQPTPSWREQVGLPIVEGLSYGCTVVTTTETGLASWLAAAGHQVTSADATAEELAAAILAAVRHPLQAGDVLASLPDVDGRLAADDWLFRRTDLPLGDDRTETSHV